MVSSSINTKSLLLYLVFGQCCLKTHVHAQKRPNSPSRPSVPSTPNFPSAPSSPSFPSTPTTPSFPSKPSFPSVPSTPSFEESPPSSPNVPSAPKPPNTPSAPKPPNVSTPGISPTKPSNTGNTSPNQTPSVVISTPSNQRPSPCRLAGTPSALCVTPNNPTRSCNFDGKCNGRREDCSTCPSDCRRFDKICGDGICVTGEDCISCPSDCASGAGFCCGFDRTFCDNIQCHGNGFRCESICEGRSRGVFMFHRASKMLTFASCFVSTSLILLSILL